tara:strand:- start:560 stop:1384 length:825 start_codon:yes stop_codon:yes gene_type:complete
MAYTGTYEQELRKNPTDYKLRAMGKKKYELKRRESDGKVTISTKDDPKNIEGFRSKKNAIESERKSRKRTKSIFDAVRKIKEEQKSKEDKSSQREAGEKKETKKDENKSNRVPAERKAYENSKDSYLAIDRQTRSKQKDKKKRDVNIPSQALENIVTGTAGVSLLLGGYALKKVKDKRKADKIRMASEKLKNMKPAEKQKVLKETLKRTMDKMKNAKPSLKQKIKSQIKKLRQKLSSGLRRSGGGVGGNINITPGGTGNIPPIKGRFKKTDINL